MISSDIKIGSITYGPDASEQKRIQQDSKYVGTKKTFGFSVQGMRVHPLKENSKTELIKLDKNFGETLKSDEISKVPRIFFDMNNRLIEKV
jgi:hypothetical protein